ncbi:MAG: hypothetical protein ACJ74G_13520 [Blastocatellia bacterium]
MNRLKILAAALLTLTAVPDARASQNRRAHYDKPQVRVLGTFTNRFKMVNKYILVAKGLSEAELVKMASSLHQAEPEVNFWLLDNASKSEQMLKWVKAYEAGKATAFDPVFEWIGDHTVANLQQWGLGSGKHWVLSKGIGMDKIADIE